MNSNVLKTRINWNYWAPPLIFLVSLVIEKETLGTFYAAWLYGLILIFYGIIYSLRYRLVQPAILFCLAGITLWHYMLAAHFDITMAMLRQIGFEINKDPANNPFSMITWIVNLIIFLVMIPVFGPVLMKALQIEISSRKLFRIAAQTVTSATDGFTTRPFHVGETGYSKEEITGFSMFLSGQNIVHTVFRDEGIYLCFSMGISPLAANNPSETSYLFIDKEGDLVVNIASSDYRKFSRKFTFDQLCRAFGDVFKRFLQYYLTGQEKKFLTDLK